ncbi:MAG: protein jag [Christensenellaceae bacterium]|nr:protein jag [Christensenellaceae bacterium]
MDFIESKGKTVDEAVFNGLVKMDLSIDEVDIEILDEGGGLFKSARVRLTRKPADAVVPFEPEKPREEERPRRDEKRAGERRESDRCEKRSSGRHERERRSSGRREEKRREVGIPEDFVAQEPANDAEKFLLGLFERMNMAVTIKSEMQDGILKLNLSGRGMGVLIGRRGETLDALQYLTSLVVNNGKSEYTKIMLDTENYRKKREDTLRRLAKRLAEKVQNSGKRVVLEPMNPYERRILHSTLQNYENVYTYSEGEDPFRSVVVALKGDEPGAEEAHAAQQAKK